MLKCGKERIKLKNIFANFIGFTALLMCCGVANAEQMPNPRSAVASNSSRSNGRVVGRADADVVRTASQKNARGTVARSANVSSRSSKTVAPISARSATKANKVARSANMMNSSRSAANTVARIARQVGQNKARSGMVANTGLTRVGALSRATALFTDVSKIGGGYAACRDSYATCMDQFCGAANDTYRRCFCSQRFVDFRDAELAMDEAKTLLMRFEDNNLNAVDKTADEVNAMYSASIGEAAIKKDTSGAQKILDEIGDLLAGKKKATPTNVSGSLGIMSLDFSTDMDDIWGGDGSSVFDVNTGVDMTSLEGQSLYEAANKQCMQVISDQCESSAVLNMATSSYGIMITQDCNAYEKNVNKKREGVLQTVRQAEKILREARLEEYRAHNSQDVNECLDKVRTAMLADTACGANYKRCMDYSGAYINQNTGEPIYSPRLFELENTIVLGGANADTDLLGQNPKFNTFLDEKKMFATTALDSCRSISDMVWSEFKRTALIEIAQAQDEKIEEVKMSCVNTMAECYDTQSSALKDFDTTTAQASGAVSAYAAKAMCQEKVTACAALYGNNSACTFDGNGHLTSNANACGLTALLAFVDSVDNVRVAEGCATAVDAYIKDLCTPSAGTMGYPWNCRKLNFAGSDYNALKDIKASSTLADLNNDLARMVAKYAVDTCSDPNIEVDARTYDKLPVQTRTQIENTLDDVYEELSYQLSEMCEGEGMNGYWLVPSSPEFKGNHTMLGAFYRTVYESNERDYTAYGKCVENTTRVRCEAYNSNASREGEESVVFATYDLTSDTCKFEDAWYEQQCKLLGNGYFENGICYVIPE